MTDVADEPDLSLRDAEYVARWMPLLRIAVKTWYRSEVTGIENVPDEGGTLIISNHSGGLIAMDVPVIAVAFHDHFGMDRPLHVLAHDMLFLNGQSNEMFRKAGFLPANRTNARAVLEGGGSTILFPGGDYDVFRPTINRNKIDFYGRTGYVRLALETGVPIVPTVSIGGQESQLILARGELLAKLLQLDKLMRMKQMPITFGFPFGFTFAGVGNLPLPTKIRTRVLEPIDVEAEFGPDPDIAEVDTEVRSRMQTALDELAQQRRFPILG